MSNLDHTIFNERPESQDRAIAELRSMGYAYVPRAEAEAKRGSLSKVLFPDELRKFLGSQTFNYRNKLTAFSERSIGAAIRDLDVTLERGLMAASKNIYDMLLLGRSYEETLFDGAKQSFDLPFIDWEHPERNIWQVTDEFSVERDNGKFARPDIVLLVNGIPLVVIECKNSCIDVIEGVRQNVRNWQPDYIPNLFKFAQLVVAMNPNDVRYATCGTPAEFYAKWQEEDGRWLDETVRKHIPDNHPTVQDRNIVSLFSRERLLNLMRYYVFYDNGIKKIARYQQYFGVENIMRRIKQQDKKGTSNGVIWHTQGSGKSLTMVMLTKRIMADPEMSRARFVLVCDRVNLVKQLRDNFIKSGLKPIQATTGRGLISLLEDQGNGIITTTINKFEAAAKSRAKITDENIILLVDESHRSHKGEFHNFMSEVLPNATKIGFTGTPLMRQDRLSTYSKFGPLIGKAYKFSDGIRDGVIVPLVYEGRIVDQNLTSPQIDEYLQRILAPLTDEQKEDMRQKWSRFLPLAQTDQRLSMIAFDIHHHFMTYCKPHGFKAMIAASSRACAIDLQDKINALGGIRAAALICPENTPDGEEGELTSQDKKKIHTFFKEQVVPRFGANNYEAYEEWVKNNINGGNDLDIVVVKDMLLTGFDAPPLGVLYVDKSMKEHTLLQAIARVNRIYPGKDFGLIVDYFGIFGKLNIAMELYNNDENAAAAGLNDFNGEDLDQSLTNATAKCDELLGSHKKLLAVFDGHEIDIRNPRDCQNVFAEEDNPAANDLRKDFYERLHIFSRLMELAMGSYTLYKTIGFEQMQALKQDLLFFQKLRASLELIHGEKVDFSKYEDGIRSLLNTFVTSAPVAKKIEPVMIHDAEAMDKQLMELDGGKAKAAYIKTRLVAELESKRYDDPLRYKKFSERIRQTLDEYREQRDENVYFERMKQIADDFRQGYTGNHYPVCIQNDNDAKAFYGIVSDFLGKYGDLSDAEYDEALGTLSLDINAAIKSLTRVDWRHNNAIHKNMTQAIEDLLWDFSDKHQFEWSEEDLDKILESTKKTALSRY
jgi:type I site-specific deoxyribonuclease, hsdR family